MEFVWPRHSIKRYYCAHIIILVETDILPCRTEEADEAVEAVEAGEAGEAGEAAGEAAGGEVLTWDPRPRWSPLVSFSTLAKMSLCASPQMTKFPTSTGLSTLRTNRK